MRISHSNLAIDGAGTGGLGGTEAIESNSPAVFHNKTSSQMSHRSLSSYNLRGKESSQFIENKTQH